MLQFYVNVIAGLGSFALSLWIPGSSIIALTKPQISSALLVASGIALHWIGPNPVAFGLFLGSGWLLLNQAVDGAFPQPGPFSHHRTG